MILVFSYANEFNRKPFFVHSLFGGEKRNLGIGIDCRQQVKAMLSDRPPAKFLVEAKEKCDRNTGGITVCHRPSAFSTPLNFLNHLCTVQHIVVCMRSDLEMKSCRHYFLVIYHINLSISTVFIGIMLVNCLSLYYYLLIHSRSRAVWKIMLNLHRNLIKQEFDTQF